MFNIILEKDPGFRAFDFDSGEMLTDYIYKPKNHVLTEDEIEKLFEI